MCSLILTPGAEVSIGLNGPPFFSLSGFRSQMSRWLGPPDIQRTMQLRLVLAKPVGIGFERREELDRRDAQRRGGEVSQPMAAASARGDGRDAAEITGRLLEQDRIRPPAGGDDRHRRMEQEKPRKLINQ